MDWFPTYGETVRFLVGFVIPIYWEIGGKWVNQQQRRVLKVCAAVIGIMLIFPPFVVYLPNGVQSNEGYSFIFFPPSVGWSFKPTVDLLRLLMQWIGVATLGGIAYGLANQSNSGDAEKKIATDFDLEMQALGPMIKLSGPVLRIIRGGLALTLALIGINLIVGLLQTATLDPQSANLVDWGKLAALYLVKVIAIVALLWINRFIGYAINRIYRTHYGRTADVIVKWRDL